MHTSFSMQCVCSHVLSACIGNAASWTHAVFDTTLYLPQMSWKLYPFRIAELLPLNYSYPWLINMYSSLLTSSLPHPTPPSPQLPSLLLHASLIPVFVPPSPSFSLKRKRARQFMKSQTAWSILSVSGEEPQESVHLRCFGEKGWREGWKSGTRVVQTPPSSFHPSPPKASRVYLALGSASDF